MESIEYQIVVARYNENINYLSLFKDIMIVYNKGDTPISSIFNSINLPNVGRESHTYLYHIIQNYDTLANRTLFIQGRIDDHKLLPIIEYFIPNDFVGKLTKNNINYIKSPIKHEGKYLKELIIGSMKRSKYTPYEWINKIGIDISKIKEFDMVWGANFCVSKELIYKKPKAFYEDIIKYVHYHINPEEGHFFERSWYLIFNHSKFIQKKKVYHYYTNKVTEKLITICNKIVENNDIEEIHIWTNNIKNDIPLIYNKTHDYIEIKPNIVNNSFSITIKEELNLLIKFNNKISYEVNIKKREIIIILFNNKEIINNIKNKNYNTSNEYIIYFSNNNITITDKINNMILIKNNLNNDKINIEDNNLINIYVKKSINIFNYNNINNINNINNKISQIYTKNSEIDQIFYEMYYENYFKDDLSSLLITQ